MQMIRPFFGQLRRSNNPAVWSRCKITSKNTIMSFKMNRIQVRLQFIYIQIKYFHSIIPIL